MPQERIHKKNSSDDTQKEKNLTGVMWPTNSPDLSLIENKGDL